MYGYFAVTCAVDLLVITNNKSLKLSARNIAKTGKCYTLLIKVFLLESGVVFFLKLQIIEEYISVHSTTCEAHVIIKPIDAANFVHMALALHILRTFHSVEVVNVNRILCNSGSKHVPAIRKLYFSATFDWQSWYVLLWLDAVRKNVEYFDFVLERNDDMETRWMESNCSYIFA